MSQLIVIRSTGMKPRPRRARPEAVVRIAGARVT